MVPHRAARPERRGDPRRRTPATTTWRPSHYDSKWGIDFGEIGRDQVLAKVDKALGHRPDGWRRSLEIGAGTGYFTLNLLRAGLISEATCSDISPGMLAALRANAERARPGGADRAGRRRATAVRRRELRPRARPRRAAPHPRPRARVRRVRARARTRRHAPVRRRALALRRSSGARAQARRRRARAAVAPCARRAARHLARR